MGTLAFKGLSLLSKREYGFSRVGVEIVACVYENSLRGFASRPSSQRGTVVVAWVGVEIVACVYGNSLRGFGPDGTPLGS